MKEQGRDQRVWRAIAELGPLEAFRNLVAENNALIASPRLDNGREIVTSRTAIFTELTRYWAQEQYEKHGYAAPFAVVALGGTGRGEMTPHSDTDFAFLFDEDIEGNEFLLELQSQVLYENGFESRFGFVCGALPFSLEDVPSLEGTQLNSFLDMRPVFDPSGLVETFRERIRDTCDPFAHFLHVRQFWLKEWEKASRRSEDLDRFDIKNDGLRIFLAGIWTLAGSRFCHASEIYDSIDDPRDLEAYEFLLRIRSYIHMRRDLARQSGFGSVPANDVLFFEDFVTLGDLAGEQVDEAARFDLGNDIRARLLSARRRIALFTKRVIREDLRRGRSVNPRHSIVFGLGGLRHAADQTGLSDYERSRSAFALLFASQYYRVPVDLMAFQDTFRNAGDWLCRVPELSALFYESRGSLADTFAFLSQIDGAEDRLFPGYAKFETSLDSRVMEERKSLRGKLQREKIRALECMTQGADPHFEDNVAATSKDILHAKLDVGVEARSLNPDSVAGTKLALKAKRLPVTARDLELRADESINMYQRFATGLSGIPLEDYFDPFVNEAGFSRACVEVAVFLIANRRVFKELGFSGVNDKEHVEKLAELCGDVERLRALFVFTCADRVDWEDHDAYPERWFNINELYVKTLNTFRETTDTSQALARDGYPPEDRKILGDFGREFFSGVYASYFNKFGPQLLRMANNPDFNRPRVAHIKAGASSILGLAARDYRGLAATVSGEFLRHQIDLRQAHFFSSRNQGLAMNFYHFDPVSPKLLAEFIQNVEVAVSERHHLNDFDLAELSLLKGVTTHREWRPNQYRLSFEGGAESKGQIYTLCAKLYRHLEANIFALKAHASSKKSYVSIYHNLPDHLSADEARRRVEEHF